MQAFAAIADFARSGGAPAPSGAYERVVDSSKDAKEGPWRPYLTAYVQRFNSGLTFDELLDKVDGVYDPSRSVFSNNFITTLGGTENAAAVWRWLGATTKRIDLAIEGIQVRFIPDKAGTATAAPAGVQEDAGAAPAVAAGPPRGKVELDILSEQRWHWPQLLVLVRWVFGDVATVRVTSTLTIDSRGLIVSQKDVVNNWLTLPLPLRLLAGLAVPAALTLARPT